MVGIILTILKVIGIILLCLIGIVLLLIGTVLLNPIHYQVKGSKEGKVHAVIDVNWIFRILRIHGCYEQGKDFEYYVKVLFFKVYQKEEKAVSETFKKKKDSFDKKNNQKENERKEIQKETLKEEKKEPQAETSKAQNNKSQKNEKQQQKKETKTDKQRPRDEKRQKEVSKEEKKSEDENIFSKIKDKIEHIKTTFQKICNKVKEIISRYEKFRDFIQSEETKETLKFLKKQWSYLVRHIKPNIFQVEMHYGMEDPAQTGELLAIYSVICPFLPGKWNVIPDFENVCLNGSVNIKGKIRLIWLLVVGWRCYKNKTIRKYISFGK